MNNALIAIDKSGSFRVYLAVSTELAAEGCKIHGTGPVATAALGRVLTGAGLMGLTLKSPKDKLTVQFKGDGPAGEVLATAWGSGVVKGYISDALVDLPPKDDGSPDVGGALGTGTLTVIKDMGLKEPYMGRISLVTGEIADDLTAYFFISEQQNTSVALGVSADVDGTVKAAGGMIIQMLPEAAPGTAQGAADALEELLAKLPPFSGLVEQAAALAEAAGGAEGRADGTGAQGRADAAATEGADQGGPAVDALADLIFGSLPSEFALEILEHRKLQWRCDCSMERLEQVLLTIGEDQLRQLAEEDGQAELTCQFCRKKYYFDREHLDMLLRVAVQSKEILAERRRRQEQDKEREKSGGFGAAAQRSLQPQENGSGFGTATESGGTSVTGNGAAGKQGRPGERKH